jgi:site-specific recombinase XerD
MTAATRTPAEPDLSDLLVSWKLALEGSRKSPQTIGSYLLGVRLYLDWCGANGHPPVLDRKQVQTWVVHLLNSDRSAANARARQSALRAYSKWLAAEEELPSDPLLGIAPPRLDMKVVDALSDDELADVDRYLRRARRKHRLAQSSSALWLGGGGQGFPYHGLDRALKRRAEMAGLRRLHIHQLRHTFASRWVTAEGSEGGLMAVARWSSRQMVDRYTRSVAADRATAEARRLRLGDI